MSEKLTPARVTLTEAAKLRGLTRKGAWKRYRKFASTHPDGKLRVPLERVLADKLAEDPETPLLPEVVELRAITDALSVGLLKLARRIVQLEKHSRDK